MTRILSAAALTLTLALAAPAMAKSSQKFQSTVTAPAASAVNVEVVIGEDLAYRANNLPKDLRGRGSAGVKLNSGFSNNGFYGERDLNKLAARLEKKMERRLAKEGVSLNDQAATTLRLVITDVKPNRPTFNQMSKEVGLSFRSYGTGGASFEGQLINAAGQPLGDVSYAWYETSIQNSAGSSTWTDANRAMDRFARNTAKSFKN